jgi:ribosomal protein S14
MLFSKNKDIQNRIKFFRIEKNFRIKKYLVNNLLSFWNFNQNLFSASKLKQVYFLTTKLKKNYLSKVKIIRRCILTNRNRRIIRPYNISHSIFKNLIQFGLIPGIKKSAW